MERPNKGLFLFLTILSIEKLICNVRDASALCLDSEREALTKFRNGLNDSLHWLSSWDSPDCCNWRGIGCDNETGYVTKLDIHNSDGLGLTNLELPFWEIGSRLDPALLVLKHLQYLDISGNPLNAASIPEFLGSLTELQYLNLASAGFRGEIPRQLGNLSKLEFLDVSSSYYLSSENLQWLMNLHSLKHLELNYANLSMACHDLVHIMTKLPSLIELHLKGCSLTGPLPSLSFGNFTSLRVLDLSLNYFNSTIPYWVANISTLISLDLSYNMFQGLIPERFSELPYLEDLYLDGNGDLIANCSNLFEGSWTKIKLLSLYLNMLHGEIPSSISNITSLVILNLSYNDISGAIPSTITKLANLENLSLSRGILTGPIPASMGRLKSLRSLELASNGLNGTLPTTLGQLSRLTVLDLLFNSFNGFVSEIHFRNLNNLNWLWMGSNSLVFDLPPAWVPPFQLEIMDFRSCNLGPHFPPWLQTQKSLRHLDISNTSIAGTVPAWFLDLIPHLQFFNLSYNRIDGELPNMWTMQKAAIVDLSSNRFHGSIPHALENIQFMYLSNNRFSGPIPQNITQSMHNLLVFSVFGNQLNGTIPSSMGELEYLNVLDLSGNSLSGLIPWSLGSCSNLEVLDLSSNNFSGEIPQSLGLLKKLKTLHLNNNHHLSGELPWSLKNWSNLETLDLGENKFSGNIPSWISENLTSLRVLRLRSNMFIGRIPPLLATLAFLQVLDLADNFLSGSIPQGLGNFSAMKNSKLTSHLLRYGSYIYYEERLLVSLKGQTREYNRSLSLVTCIDLSGNHLSGEMPKLLTSLIGLIVLNLSRNHLTGTIPDEISNLRELMSLDFSENRLSGELPLSMTSLTFLSYVNFSNNNFSGRIPSGNQFLTFDASSFSGNQNLCGLPLTDKCYDEGTTTKPPVGYGVKTMKDYMIPWFDVLSVILGYAVGLSAALFALKPWKLLR